MAWRLYKEDKSIEIMSESLRNSCIISEVLRSIHVGLLCVQHHAEHRPTMLSVVLMLVSEGVLPPPKQPAFFIEESCREHDSVSSLDEYMITLFSADSIVVYQNITDGETIVSENQIFEMGFFSPGSSRNRYLGIWFKNTSPHTVVWVANRETPLFDTLGIFKLDNKGILSLVNGGGKETYLTSWRRSDDPSPGEYTVRFLMVQVKYQQVYIRKSSMIETRIGPYEGIAFAGEPNFKPNPVFSFKLEMVVNLREMYFVYTSNSNEFQIRQIATPEGKLEIWNLNMHTQEWRQALTLPLDNCDKYGLCGPYRSCSTVAFPNCGCLKGFELKKPEESSPNNWTRGCQRSRALDCGPGEGFLKLSSMKLPDTQNAVFDDMSLQECEVACKNNCSCTAYANPNTTPGGVGCLLWFGDLIDV
ncbi:hypothetical protein L6452_34936 [Arctium lappa]|uniref:Uncharacterized protein n=1 Tax=Arctium lappa TaxID=4217 RepID=A0ACB8YKS3_ARCLA|nr:hypothetical protein L6452_34936 [Arctium lappa]